MICHWIMGSKVTISIYDHENYMQYMYQLPVLIITTINNMKHTPNKNRVLDLLILGPIRPITDTGRVWRGEWDSLFCFNININSPSMVRKDGQYLKQTVWFNIDLWEIPIFWFPFPKHNIQAKIFGKSKKNLSTKNDSWYHESTPGVAGQIPICFMDDWGVPHLRKPPYESLTVIIILYYYYHGYN